MYYGYGYYYDPTIILVIIGAIISGIASMNVQRTYKKYSRVRNYRGLTSNQVAEHILHAAGIYDVRIERIRGNLTDHYSPKEKVLRLSDAVYGQTSVAALGVAAHECGHAIQHQQGYAPSKYPCYRYQAFHIQSLTCPQPEFWKCNPHTEESVCLK